MRRGSLAMLAIVCLAASACELAGAWRSDKPEAAPGFLFVRKPKGGLTLTSIAVDPQELLQQPLLVPDGSAGRPFATVSAALAAAPAGALVSIDEGDFEERLLIVRPVLLLGRGAGKTRLLQPAGSIGAALELRDAGRVELRGLAVEGGEAGVFVDKDSQLRLEAVALRGFNEAALVARGGAVAMVAVEIVDVGHGVAGRGVELFGGSLDARKVVLRAAGRRAIVLHKATAVLTDVDAANSAVAALQAIDGSVARVVRGRFEHLGGAALYAGASRLIVEGAHLAWNEYGIIGFRGADLGISDAELLDQRVAAIAMVSSRGFVRRCHIARGGSEGAIAITEASGPVALTDNSIQEPGTMGVHITHSTVIARGNSITGAGLDGQKDLGDAFFAIDADVSLDENVLRANAGSGVETLRTKLRMKGNGLLNNGRAGVLLLDRSKATATGNYFEKNQGASVELAEGARATLAKNRFGGGSQLDIDIACASRGVAELEAGNTFGGPSARQRVCP
jgi:hypothetical protein